MMPRLPSPNGSNGRDSTGRFIKGNPGGPGNPRARQIERLRSTMLRAVTAKDLRAIVKALIEKAKAGDVMAAREVMDRCFGKPRQSVDLEAEARVESMTPDPHKSIENMSDLELAQTVAAGGIEVPLILKRKVKLILEQNGQEIPEAFR